MTIKMATPSGAIPAGLETSLARSFEPMKLAGLSLRNRYVKTATFENRSPGGRISPDLAQFHREVAAGGTGLSTVAYCGVSPDARTFDQELVVNEESLPALKAVADAVHAEGGAVSGQLAHCGGFSRAKPTAQPRPLGPNFGLNTFGMFHGLPFAGAMKISDIRRTLEDYARSARQLVHGAGFDALEIHMGHGYLLSQFISPAINRRTDEYGGSLQNRLRFPLQVVEIIRKAVGDQVPLLAKINLSDAVPGGVDTGEAVAISRTLEAAGIDAIVMSGGLISASPMYLFRGDSPLKQMIEAESNPAMRLAMRLGGPRTFRSLPFEPLFFRKQALRVRDAVGVPLAYLGGVCSGEDVAKLMSDGFDLVCIGRALLYDPAMTNKLRQDARYRSPCDHCNQCVPTIAHPNGTHCVRKAAAA